MHAAARELLEMFAAKREIVDDIGRDEEVMRWLLAAIEPFAKPDLARAIGALHLMPVKWSAPCDSIALPTPVLR